VEDEDSEGFAEFYIAARDDCLRAVCAAVGDPLQAEELTAEAFARAFAHWRKLKRHPAPRAWIVRVALNTHVSWWRKRRREVHWHSLVPAHVRTANVSGAELHVRGTAGDLAPDSRLDFDGPAMSALRALPRRQREVIALRIILDLDTHATAEALGISPKTVAVHFSRATAALRATLILHTDEERLAP
jgi:RNA polymerase sigma-70 factor (ECF subfamily)